MNGQRKSPYSTLTRILQQRQKVRFQQFASVLLPIAFCAFLIVICVVATLAILTDGFTLCAEKQNDSWTTDVCVSDECIRKAFYLVDRLDRSVDFCEDFQRFACGKFKAHRRADTFAEQLKDQLEQRPRHASSILFDFYDSCIDVDQQGIQPFHLFVSKLGGWPLLQNAQFNVANFDFAALDRQLTFFSIPTLLDVMDAEIRAPAFLLSTHRRQKLDDFFVRILAEFDVDEKLASEAVEEALDCESQLMNGPKEVETLRLSELTRRYNSIDWTKFFDGDPQIRVDSAHLDRLLMQTNKNGSALANYVWLKTLFAVSPHLPSKFRVHRDRLDSKFEARWRLCVDDLENLLTTPLIEFAFQQIENSDVRSETIGTAKRQIAAQIRKWQWLDAATRQILLQNLHNLRVIVNVEAEMRGFFRDVRLDRAAYFDNVLMLKSRQRSADVDGKKLLLSKNAILDFETKKIVYGPTALRTLIEKPKAVQLIEIRKALFEFLLSPQSNKQFKPEVQSILNAKFSCFARSQTQIFNLLALESAEEQSHEKLPGLSDFNTDQLLYVFYGASNCDEETR
ncbi:Neprilysin-2-like protein [Aphelenchoides besseyi]|nr:Neprilysin-2-like protein [Aphelenchoides besseyi]